MRRVAIILLVASSTGFAGCQTTSGRAIHGRLSYSLDQLWRSTAAVLGGELDRSSRFIERAREFRIAPQARLGNLVADSRTLGSGATTRLQNMPGSIMATAGAMVTDSVTRVRAIGNGENRFIEDQRPGPLLARWRDGVIAFVNALDISRFILPGPGDPDRTADPNVLTRQETWIERLLQRF